MNISKNYLLIFLLLVFSISLFRSARKVGEAEEIVRLAEERIDKIAQENEALESDLDFVGKEVYFETQLRDKLGMAKENEIVVVLPEERIVRSFAPPLNKTEISLPDSNWRKWLKVFEFSL
jgi:cell division protein FtsB